MDSGYGNRKPLRGRLVSGVSACVQEKSLEELLNEFDAEWNQWYELGGLNNEGFDETDAFRETMKKVDTMITSQNKGNELYAHKIPSFNHMSI